MASRMNWNRRAKQERTERSFRTDDTAQARKYSRERECFTCGERKERITISNGAHPNGSLRIFTFCSQPCAASAGFPWAGR